MNSPSTESKREVFQSLRFGFQQIPEDGLQFRFSEPMRELCIPGDENEGYEKDLEAHFRKPIEGECSVFKVGSKVHAKGYFATDYSGLCDRCLQPANTPLRGGWEVFLMPHEQFVQKGHEDEDQEDVGFTEFDGQTVDLRSVLREEVVLQAPMKLVCQPDCKGLCPECGQNLNQGDCEHSRASQEASSGPLAGLAAKFRKNKSQE